jgi:hypothetical protein
VNLRVPFYAGKLLSSCTTSGRSRYAQLNGVSTLVGWLVTAMCQKGEITHQTKDLTNERLQQCNYCKSNIRH